MAIDDKHKRNEPLPEPWQMLDDLAYWLERARSHAGKDDPAAANAELRDAMRAAMLDLLTIVKFYRTDREHPADVSRELVARYTLMAFHEDGTITTHGVFATEQEAMDAATRLMTETTGIARTWVQRSLVSVALEEWREMVERVLAETGLTEDELADAVARSPESSSSRRRRERPHRRTLAPAGS